MQLWSKITHETEQGNVNSILIEAWLIYLILSVVGGVYLNLLFYYKDILYCPTNKTQAKLKHNYFDTTLIMYLWAKITVDMDKRRKRISVSNYLLI